MCGIVGYDGKKEATSFLIDGLSKLEYRGYDSAGIAVENGSKVTMVKHKGRLKNLSDDLEKNPVVGTVGIGHTRWATHGEPSDVNSHPHKSSKGEIAVVHNGIIENYLELRKWLKEQGYEFKSQTDTEVIPNLIHYFFKGDLLEAVMKDDLDSVNAFEKSVEKYSKDVDSFVKGIDFDSFSSKLREEFAKIDLDNVLKSKETEEKQLRGDVKALEAANTSLELAQGERTSELEEQKSKNTEAKQQNATDLAGAEATRDGLASLQYESWAKASKACDLAKTTINEIEDAITAATNAKEDAAKK